MRPQLSTGSLVYAKITLDSKYLDPEISCFNSSTGKSEGMGELKGGMVFDISLGFARRLLMPRQKEDAGVAILESLAEKLPFEVAIGRNGKVWVNAGGTKEVLMVGKALQTVDEAGLGLHEQEKLVKSLLRG